MLRSRKKKKNWLRCFASFFILAFVIFMGVRFRAQVVSYSRTAWLVMQKPDIASILHATRHEGFGMACVTDTAGADDCYMFDTDGIIFKPARMVVDDVIARVDVSSDFKPVLGVMLADADIWQNMAGIIAYAKDGLSTNRMEFIQAEKELIITLSDSGTRLYFSVRFDPAEHIRALKELQKTVSLATLEYADLRVKGRVFYK